MDLGSLLHSLQGPQVRPSSVLQSFRHPHTVLKSEPDKVIGRDSRVGDVGGELPSNIIYSTPLQVDGPKLPPKVEELLDVLNCEAMSYVDRLHPSIILKGLPYKFGLLGGNSKDDRGQILWSNPLEPRRAPEPRLLTIIDDYCGGSCKEISIIVGAWVPEDNARLKLSVHSSQSHRRRSTTRKFSWLRVPRPPNTLGW